MRPMALGARGEVRLVTGAGHTADALGNTGVRVVSTVSLVLAIEEAAARAIADGFEAGEVSVGTEVDVRHVAAARAGCEVVAVATLEAVEGRRMLFAVEARTGDRLLMTGRHARVVVDLERFLARQGLT